MIYQAEITETPNKFIAPAFYTKKPDLHIMYQANMPLGEPQQPMRQ